MLKCTREFIEGDYRFSVGAIVALAPSAESWLLDSYPGYFERVQIVDDAQPAPALDDEAQPIADAPAEAAPQVEARDVEAPQVDKMVKRPSRRK